MVHYQFKIVCIVDVIAVSKTPVYRKINKAPMKANLLSDNSQTK